VFITNEKKRETISKQGLSSTYNWEVHITIPNILRNKLIGVDYSERLLIACEESDVPGTSISVAERNEYQNTKKIPFGFFMEDVSMTFRVSDDYAERKFFESWRNLIINPETRNFAYYDDIVSEVNIRHYDHKLKAVRHDITLKEAFPFSILPLAAAQSGETPYYRQTIGWKYRTWESNLETKTNNNPSNNRNNNEYISAQNFTTPQTTFFA
jgi:hypothetical protein